MRTAVPNGTIRPDSNGYFKIKDPTHPLAETKGGRKGWVKHHRWIVYNYVNGQPQSCAYCGYGPIPWKGSTWTAINVDHINETKGDDRIENLTTACFWCNLLKSGWPLTYHEHMHAIDKYGHLEPTQRPTPMTILLDEWLIPINDVRYNLELNRQARL